MRKQFFQGATARKNFEEAMQKLLRVPKPPKKEKPPKKAASEEKRES